MSKKKKKVKPVPRGYRTVTASLNITDAGQFIEFCKKAFGAKLRSSMPGPGDKIIHAEIQIGDSMVMVSDAVQDPARPSNLFLYVPDVDKTFAKAVKAGAKVLTPVTDMFWGDRFCRVEDSSGNRWQIASRTEEVSKKELKKRMAAMAPPA